ncbi:hypothetical protein ACFOVU_15280 [Nocardiopsis sediminis]|uniref:Uncharacterized protein n=1 Tax=Nocardiopsis sediminis TaxID=1778267 RepID=A0ABV8FRF0_9ACTN
MKASYFWDDGSGINGDTGAPASGQPMQEGLAASPSWPLGTEGYVEYNGKKADFFIGDRGPGDPAGDCNVLLDLDGKTFAKLTGQSWDDSSYTVSGGEGHINVDYHITKWGDGNGTEGAPQPMGTDTKCTDAVSGQGTSGSGGGNAQADQQQSPRDSQSAPAASQQGDGGSGSGPGTGVQASTAANDLSGLQLAGADAPMAASAVTAAVLPALAVAVLLTKFRPALAKGLSGAGDRFPSVFTTEGRKRLTDGARERLTRVRDEYMR